MTIGAFERSNNVQCLASIPATFRAFGLNTPQQAHPVHSMPRHTAPRAEIQSIAIFYVLDVLENVNHHSHIVLLRVSVISINNGAFRVVNPPLHFHSDIPCHHSINHICEYRFGCSVYPFYLCGDQGVLLFGYRLVLHPLRHYPGPLLAKLSSAYAGFYAASMSLHVRTRQDHLKYGIRHPTIRSPLAHLTRSTGPVLRSGPNRLVFSSIKAIQGDYHTSPTGDRVGLTVSRYISQRKTVEIVCLQIHSRDSRSIWRL